MKAPGETDEAQGAGHESAAAARGPEPASAPAHEPAAAASAASADVLLRELREAQAEVRRLRAFLSHGLRQPMAALTIWAELLNAKQASALDEQGRRYLRELTASVHRIASMLSAEMQATSPAAGSDPKPSDEPAPPEARRAARGE